MYKTLNSSDRHLSNDKSPYNRCDRQLSEGWYRFEDPAGNRMPTECTTIYRCGKSSPGWIDVNYTPLPGEDDGEKGGIKVCFPSPSDCCDKSTYISVKNCGSYYVYRLSGTPAGCPKRYCGTD